MKLNILEAAKDATVNNSGPRDNANKLYIVNYIMGAGGKAWVGGMMGQKDRCYVDIKGRLVPVKYDVMSG